VNSAEYLLQILEKKPSYKKIDQKEFDKIVKMYLASKIFPIGKYGV